MRVIRSLILLLGVAIAAAGCAQQPVAYMAYPAAGMPGIDNMVYGMGGPYAPAMIGGAYGAAPYGGLYGYAPTAGEGYYTLDSGDRLRIVVFGQDGLTNSYVVSAGGNIDMPLIGQVSARGLTTDQLAGRLAEKLRDGYIREPHVAVEIEAYRPFFILGEVTAPGQYPYVANMTAETAVAIAGGFTARASRKNVTLNRNYYGRPMRMAVPLNFPLRPGDTINVQERWF
jgi:polysaccharide export outer membrane protein